MDEYKRTMIKKGELKMSIIVNRPEAQLKKITFHHLEGQPTAFAHVTKRAKHMIYNLVIFDPETKKVVLGGSFGEIISHADVKIDSFGSTKKILNKHEFDLGNKDIFLFHSEWGHMIPDEHYALDVHIPITYFSDIEITTTTCKVYDDKEKKKIEADTEAHLYYKDENGNTSKLGTIYHSSKEFELF